MIAARARRAPRTLAETAAEALTHAREFVFHALHLAFPALAAVATHVPAPECEGENGEPDWPPDDEAEYQEHDPCLMDPHRWTGPTLAGMVVIHTFSGRHGSASPV